MLLAISISFLEDLSELSYRLISFFTILAIVLAAPTTKVLSISLGWSRNLYFAKVPEVL